MSDLLEYAKEMDMMIHLSMQTPFEMPNGAMLVSVNVNDEGTYVVTPVTESQDVYEMLEDDLAATVSKVSDYTAIVTCGWAAPVDNDLPPSQHSKRRRVRLVLFADHSSIASVVRFEDEPDEAVVADESAAHGALANAVFAMLDRARRQ